MRMGQVVRTGLGHGGIPCVLQTQFSSCLACEAEARHMYCFSGVVVVVGGGVNFFVLGHFLGNYKGWRHETWVIHTS